MAQVVFYLTHCGGACARLFVGGGWGGNEIGSPQIRAVWMAPHSRHCSQFWKRRPRKPCWRKLTLFVSLL